MHEPEQKSIALGLGIVVGFAIVLGSLGYFATRVMDADVSGAANTRAGLSFAYLAAIACVSALVGTVILWAGRHKTNSNTRIAIIATVVVGALLLLVALGAGTTGMQPASTTIEGR